MKAAFDVYCLQPQNKTWNNYSLTLHLTMNLIIDYRKPKCLKRTASFFWLSVMAKRGFIMQLAFSGHFFEPEVKQRTCCCLVAKAFFIGWQTTGLLFPYVYHSLIWYADLN